MFTLSRTQFFLFLFVIQTGTVFIAFQDDLLFHVGSNAWVLFILMSFVHYGQLVLYERFYKEFRPREFIMWMYKGYWLFITIVFIAYVEYTLSIWVFADTPSIVLLSIIVFVSYMANSSRPETVINLSTILLFFIPIIFLLILFTVPDYVWTRLFPIYVPETGKLVKGLLVVQTTFIGIEIYLFLRKFVLPEQKVNGKPLFIYHLLWFVFFISTLLSVQLYFPLGSVNLTTEPFLYLLKAERVMFAERLDLFFTFIWVIWSIITISLYSFMVLSINNLHEKKHKKRKTLFYHLLLVIIPLFLVTKVKIEEIQNVVVFVHLFFTIVLPIFVILLGRGKNNDRKSDSADNDSFTA